MKVVTGEEMRDIDRKTIMDMGIPGIVLMENAGLAIVHAAERFQGARLISIFVGKGNNGGDGLVAARHLANKGYTVKIYLMASADKFSGDALTNLQIAQKLSLHTELVLSVDDLIIRRAEIAKSDLIIDAIFGTGLSGPVRGFASDVIEFINSTGITVLSVDLPSGLGADTGKVEGECIRATHTVTMALPKRGLLIYPGAEYVGELEIADIGIPYEVAQNIAINMIQAGDAKKLLPKRPGDSHKGTYGRVLVLGGSVGLTGAAAMASQSALRAGAGLVTLGIPESLNPAMEVKLTEAMTLPLPETQSQTLSSGSYDKIMGIIDSFDVVAIGPGLSREAETSSLVRELCKNISIPKVIDADGLNALAEYRDILKLLGHNTVLTPHPGEMARLTGRTIKDIQSDRINIAQNFAVENGVILVLKGVPTVIAEPSGEIWLNTTGNPGLASGGTGDVLTGVIAGFIAQGVKPGDASALGAYIHGLAGDLAALDYGETGMLAGDLISHIPKAIRKRMKDEG